MLTVLGAEPGSHVRAGIPDGPIGSAEITAVADDRVDLIFTATGTPPARPRNDLVLALPRPKVLGRVLEHVTALGVGRIVLVGAWRVEKSYFQSALLEEDGYRPHLLAGLEQARDTRVPEVHVFRRFRPFVEDSLDEVLGDGRRVVLDPTAERRLEPTPAAARTAVAVGPEGGWRRYELERFREKGFDLAGLGPRVLRSETACVAALAILGE